MYTNIIGVGFSHSVYSGFKPIILLADAQTTGGYPRIMNIVTEDLDRLAQFKPGDAVRFELIKP